MKNHTILLALLAVSLSLSAMQIEPGKKYSCWLKVKHPEYDAFTGISMIEVIAQGTCQSLWNVPSLLEVGPCANPGLVGYLAECVDLSGNTPTDEQLDRLLNGDKETLKALIHRDLLGPFCSVQIDDQGETRIVPESWLIPNSLSDDELSDDEGHQAKVGADLESKAEATGLSLSAMQIAPGKKYSCWLKDPHPGLHRPPERYISEVIAQGTCQSLWGISSLLEIGPFANPGLVEYLTACVALSGNTPTDEQLKRAVKGDKEILKALIHRDLLGPFCSVQTLDKGETIFVPESWLVPNFWHIPNSFSHDELHDDEGHQADELPFNIDCYRQFPRLQRK